MINRRQLLKITDAGALSFATGGQGFLSAKPSAYAQVNTGSEFVPDLYIFLTARLLMGSAIVPIRDRRKRATL